LQGWIHQVRAAGHQPVGEIGAADLVVLNTCAVTGEAARKSRQQIRRAHRANPAADLVVTGCYSTLEADRVAAEPGVDRVVVNRHKDRLVELLALESVTSSPRLPVILTPLSARRRARAFVKIQDGCRYQCSYCIVTVARGEERSRPPAELVAEVRRLVAEGVCEVVLTGVHVGGYGSDLGETLTGLVATLLEATSIPRLRLASVEPWEIPEAFFALFTNPRLMPHLHLPLQSGADAVLRRMARRGRRADYRALVARARQAVPGINITTDIITGFPGESEREWRQTLAFVEELAFGDLHVFPFSARVGTRAAALPDRLPVTLARERCRELLEIGRRLRLNRLQAKLGQTVEVLVEGGAADADLCGYSPDYHRVVIDGPAAEQLRGTVHPVTLTAVADGVLRGRLVAS